MKTAEEYLKIWQGIEVVITKDIAIMAMKEYAKQVAIQVLKDAAKNATDDIDTWSISDITESILNTEIKLP